MMREVGGLGCEYLINSHQGSGKDLQSATPGPRPPEGDRVFSCHDANVYQGPERKDGRQQLTVLQELSVDVCLPLKQP